MDDPKKASRGELVSLREYIDMKFCAYEKANEIRFKAQEKAVEAALASADRANSKTDAAIQHRFEGVNEFRATLEVYVKTLMPRRETEALIKTLNDKVDVVTNRVHVKDATSEGRSDVWGWIVAAVLAMATIISVIVNVIK